MQVQLSSNEYLVADVKQGEYVQVASDNFEYEGGGYVRVMHEYGLTVRLDLPEDHRSMVAAIQDSGLPYDQVELEDVIPFVQVKHLPNEHPVRVWRRAVTPQERAARARQAGHTRMALPELDAGLRSAR
jgi:hypothetical protein